MSAPAAAKNAGMEKYLDPKVLAQVARLDLRTRLIVEGFITGLHRSPYQGLSVEFAQHREYVPGDDIKHIDWKVYSRSDRYFIKQYEEETNLRCTFLVDISESMRYHAHTTQGIGKFHYAACAASAMSLLLLRQQDAVGLMTFDEQVRAVVPAASNPNQIKTIVHQLEQASSKLSAKTSLGGVLSTAAEQLSRRGMVVVVSDLLTDDDESLFRGLQRLTHRGHDVMVLHIMDQEELTFPFEGNTRFHGMEDVGELTGQPRALRDGYLDSLRRWLAEVQRRCVSSRVGYYRASTADNLGASLAAMLGARADAGRRASGKRR